MKKIIEKLKSITTKQKIILALLVLNFGIFLFDSKIEEVKNSKFLLPIVLGFLALELVFVALYFHLKNKRKWKTEKIFLAFALLLGFCQIFITPINQVPDEITHIFRVYDITDGNLVAKKDENGEYRAKISKSAYKLLNNAQSDRGYYKKVVKQLIEPTSDEKWGWHFESAAMYKPVAYAPQILGVLAGKILHLPAGMTMYLGRIFALLAYAIIIYFAIKITPKFKEFFALFALLPMALQQGMAYTTDSLAIALGFLLVALAIYAIYGDTKKLDKKFFFALYPTVIILAATKSLGYLPLALILVLIPSSKFKKNWQKYLHLALLVLIPIVLNFIWVNVQDRTVVASTAESSAVVKTSANPSILDFFIQSFGTFFGTRTFYYLDGLSGRNLSYATFEAPTQIYTILMIIIVVVMVTRTHEKLKMRKFDKLVLWAIPIIIVTAFYYIAAYGWRFFGDDGATITGIQGRYYLPLLPLLPLLTYSEKKNSEPLSVDYVFLFAIFANFAILGSKFLHNI